MKLQALAVLGLAFAMTLPTQGSTQAATRHYAHHYSRVAPAATHPGYYGWGPADPGAPNRLYNYFRGIGDCVIDEGYGRVTLCD